MAHAAPPPGGHRRGAQIVGAIAVIVGLSLAVVAIVSLNRPNGRSASRTTQSGSASPTTAARSTAKTSSSATTSASRTPSSTAVTTTASSPVATSSAARTTTSAPATTPAGSGSATVAKVSLIIANNTATAGLAEGAATRFEARGWTVSQWLNFTGDILSTCAYYDPAVTGSEAAALELQREFPAIKRVKERFDGLPSAPIVVVLTTDYTG